MGTILENVQTRLTQCPRCQGKVFFTNKGGVTKRCNDCFADELFLHRFRSAYLDETKIDLRLLKKLRQLFSKSLTIALSDVNNEQKHRWAHSSAMLAAKIGMRVGVYHDQDVVNSIFGRDGGDTKRAWSERFLMPDFIALYIGDALNTKILGTYILNLLWERERYKKSTLLLMTTATKLKNQYQSEELSHFVEKELVGRTPKAYHIVDSAFWAGDIIE